MGADVNTKAQGYIDAAAWHEQQAAERQHKIRKSEEWAKEHGERDGGILYTDVLPREIDVHNKSARHFRRLAQKAIRRTGVTPSESRRTHEGTHSTTDCPRPHHLLLAGERCPTCRAIPASASTGAEVVNGFWRKMDGLTSTAVSHPELLAIILAKREAHAEALIVTGVCDRAEAERRAVRYYQLPEQAQSKEGM